jgi:2-iminobutanoate/2-iminopropanoate deaminase
MSTSSVTREIIATKNAPSAVGAYSQGVKIGDTLYISGSLGLDPATGNFVSQDVGEQTHQSLKNIGEILKAAGTTFSNVVKTTILLADINDFATVNGIYASYFKEPFPARAAYQVAALPKAARVEIEAIAHVGEITEKKSSFKNHIYVT